MYFLLFSVELVRENHHRGGAEPWVRAGTASVGGEGGLFVVEDLDRLVEAGE
jgi:hypothetical protein